MASIFSKTNNYVGEVKRNTFDMSFQNNLTMEFGKLYPVFCKEVVPGDSFQITPTFALNFMPLLFPVQTRMRANLHFFYVRNRTLWSDWMDFICNTKDGLTPPYIDFSNQEVFDRLLKTGSLGDYLGLPTTLVGSSAEYLSFSGTLSYATSHNASLSVSVTPDGSSYGIQSHYNSDTRRFSTLLSPYFKDFSRDELPITHDFICSFDSFDDLVSEYSLASSSISDTVEILFPVYGYYNISLSSIYTCVVPKSSFRCSVDCYRAFDATCTNNLIPAVTFCFCDDNNRVIFTAGWSGFSMSFSDFTTSTISKSCIHITKEMNFTPNKNYYGETVSISKVICVCAPYLETAGDNSNFLYLSNFCYPSSNTSLSSSGPFFYYGACADFTFSLPVLDSTSVDSSTPVDITFSTSPYFGSADDSDSEKPKISALPFRAYEAVYNAFYRNAQNNPYMIDGVAEYNKYIPTKDGGADASDYQLRFRNWEQDFLTTAVQSPQQGIAPLVGITSSGVFSFKDADTGEIFTATAKYGDDGDTITGFTVGSNGMPSGNIQQLMELTTSGFTISDLRNVNSFQRWLEANMRRGFKYLDQIKSHFDVDVKYDELDMPEFIGGASEDVYVNQVNQTVETEDNPLGSYAGQAACVGTSKHSINHYCDEHGFIIGIMCVTPVPNYSQLLPKFFLKRNTLDYYFPEFGHIGMQPILNQEVAPVQAYQENNLRGVFGYQRAWYDYLASNDEVHGLFRTNLRNFLINRVFDGVPELGEDFLLIDPEQVNEVFAVTSESDKILGQVYFDVVAKRPIPLFGIPKLE